MSSRKPTDPVRLVRDILGSPTLPSTVLIVAEDTIRKERIISLLTEKFVKGRVGISATQIRCRDLASSSLAPLKDELLSLSLFSSDRLFVFDEVDSLDAKKTTEIIKLLEQIPQHTTVIAKASKLPANSRILKFFNARGTAIVLAQPKGLELRKWTAKELKKEGVVQFSREAVEALIELSGVISSQRGASQLDVLIKLIEKAALFSENGKLESKEIPFIFNEAPDPGEFELLDALNRRDSKKAHLLCANLFQVGKNPFMLLGLLFRSFSTYLFIAEAMRNGKKMHQIREELNMPEWMFQKQMTGVKAHSIGKLKGILSEIVKADTRLKGRALDREGVVSILISRIAA